MRNSCDQPPLELWGGVECTINRVRDRYFNQLRRSGHWDRFEDLYRLAALGFAAFRFPVLWEALAPESLDRIDWSWTDRRLEVLRSLRVRPIVGLLHHGSGPSYTDLTDPEFPIKFACYARAVAERYPWIDTYTPINEPLTTARFSGLYGHWHPHARDNAVFARILLNQIQAIALAMREIRKVNPKATLIQTEDLGRTYSTPKLRYQANFENERRWLTWDLLRGDVGSSHPMWDYLLTSGISASGLERFRESERCPPDVLGINYYVTSERYLDEKTQNYPAELHGHNGRDFYADDAAVRARPLGLAGVRNMICAAFRRYAAPIALTEVHLACDVQEQMRWFMEAWEGAQCTRERGADVRAVTAWALLGSFDWDNLVTRETQSYEAGAFSLVNGKVEPTALAGMLEGLARGKSPHNPNLESRGWWRRRSRLRHGEGAALAA